MKWITREKVDVDPIACPWLVRRFIDADGIFEFLPKEADWSRMREGVVFDMPGCELGHRGEKVSFDSTLDKYGLHEPALRVMADTVRAADSNPSNPHPAGEGLQWIAHGFSALGLSHQELLNRKFVENGFSAEIRKSAKQRGDKA